MKTDDLELDPLNRLILAYARHAERERYALLFALDLRLADIIRSTSEQLIGQMRLTWWRDILTKTPDERPAGEPLVSLINRVEGQGADMRYLESLIDGWELLLDDFPWDDRQFENYAKCRGESYFNFVIEADDALNLEQKNAARSWALWDFARHCSDLEMRISSFSRSQKAREVSNRPVFDRSGRPLSILCELVAKDVKKGKLTADLLQPSVAIKIFWHGLTGF